MGQCRTAGSPYSDRPDGPFVEKGAAGQMLRLSDIANRKVLTRSGEALVAFNASNSGLDADLVDYTRGMDVDLMDKRQYTDGSAPDNPRGYRAFPTVADQLRRRNPVSWSITEQTTACCAPSMRRTAPSAGRSSRPSISTNWHVCGRTLPSWPIRTRTRRPIRFRRIISSTARSVRSCITTIADRSRPGLDLSDDAARWTDALCVRRNETGLAVLMWRSGCPNAARRRGLLERFCRDGSDMVDPECGRRSRGTPAAQPGTGDGRRLRCV
jgi:hypothetical protein